MNTWTYIFLIVATLVATLGFSEWVGFAAAPAQLLAAIFLMVALFLCIATFHRSD
ncbi:DUF1328 domain-containing protein [Roseibacillus persicicus]|uniref:DUF1328 domain-containing protein n=1 Tax=Roseibacillus persicicus TaxID=454148 RepID=UPI001671C674|nr:DUF1328 domain-containing protein [Roseibacillus persicicus]MDQ8192387.1 DUF1328 domain-containing protein [Roseibacillus persicicus]